MKSFSEWFDGAWLAIFMSFLGGCAYAAKNRERSLFGWACCIIVGTFSGIVTYLLVSEIAAVPQMVRVAAASASASSGGILLDLWLERLAKTAGNFVDNNTKDNGK